MAGLASPAIGLGTANAIPIGGVAKATADGAASGRGSLENFIGFGKALTSLEPLPHDLDAIDDIQHLCATANPVYTPGYAAAVPPVVGSEVLSWTTP